MSRHHRGAQARLGGDPGAGHSRRGPALRGLPSGGPSRSPSSDPAVARRDARPNVTGDLSIVSLQRTPQTRPRAPGVGAVSKRGIFSMLKSIEKALKLSEIRESLNTLNGIAEPTDAQKTEERDLIASQKSIEVEYREALTAESEAESHPTAPDAETRERLQLVARANVGAIFAARGRASVVRWGRRGTTSVAPPGTESNSGRSATRASRGTRDHTRADERRSESADPPNAGIRIG